MCNGHLLPCQRADGKGKCSAHWVSEDLLAYTCSSICISGMREQGAAPRFSGYRSPGSQAKRSPSGSQGVAPEDDHASKRSKALTPGEEPSSATADSSVTLAHGIADAPASSSEVLMPVHIMILQMSAEEVLLMSRLIAFGRVAITLSFCLVPAALTPPKRTDCPMLCASR